MTKRRRRFQPVAIGAVVLATFALTSVRLGERDRTEARAIARLRAISSAEASYAAASGGYYDTLECLVRWSCIPDRAVEAPFAAPNLGQGPQGYRLQFHAAPFHAGASRDRARISPTAMWRFAVIAVSDSAQWRSFCVDDRQTIYVVSATAGLVVDDGRCLDTTTPLR